MKNFIDTLIESNQIEINNSEKNKNFLRQAYIYWKENSDYESTWTWAIIEKDWEILSKWANVLPNWIKIEAKVIKWSKFENKIEHAERNAIYNATKNWIKLNWSIMYMPWVPCIPCANAIIYSWIKTLIMHYSKIIKTPWSRLNDVQDATEWLLKNWIKLIVINEEIGWCESKLRWEIWNP